MNNFNVFLMGLDVILMALAGYYLYWQSKIQVASRYAVTQLMGRFPRLLVYDHSGQQFALHCLHLNLFGFVDHGWYRWIGANALNREWYSGARYSLREHVQHHVDAG